MAPYSETGEVMDWWKAGNGPILVWILALVGLVVWGIGEARRRRSVSVRGIPGIQAAEEAIGRAVEMGRPVVFVPGVQGITAPGTIAALSVLRLVAEKCAQMGSRLIVPCRDTIVTSVAREVVEDAYRQAGREDLFRPEDVFFITRRQMAYVAGVNGVIERERPATIFLQGEFSAESLIFGEVGNRAGAVLIAGTDKETQLPFFITTCDYTLIGEELYAAGAAISGDPALLGSLRGIDWGRWAVLGVLIGGLLLDRLGVGWIRWLLGGG